MKVLVLNVHVPFVQGGAELLVNDLIRELKVRGHEVELLQIPNIADVKRIADNMDIWQKIDLNNFGGGKVDKVIALKWPTYGLTHPNMNIWLLHQYRSVYDLYDFRAHLLPDPKKLRKEIERFDNKHINKAKKVFTISKNVSGRLKTFNDIGSSTIYPPPSNINQFKCKAYKKYFFFPSRIVDHKRQELVVRALPFTKTDVKVVFAGSSTLDNYLDKLKNLSEKLGVDNRIVWAGRISDKDKIKHYSECLAVLYPTLDEDYGYVTLEAMFSSKAVLTCNDSGGPLEFVKDKFNGRVSLPEPKEFALVMDEVFSDVKSTKKMGENARKTVKKISFDWDKVISKLLS